MMCRGAASPMCWIVSSSMRSSCVLPAIGRQGLIWPCWLLPSLASTELSEESLDPVYAQRWLLVVGRVLGCGRAAGLDTSPVRYVAAARERKKARQCYLRAWKLRDVRPRLLWIQCLGTAMVLPLASTAIPAGCRMKKVPMRTRAFGRPAQSPRERPWLQG